MALASAAKRSWSAVLDAATFMTFTATRRAGMRCS